MTAKKKQTKVVSKTTKQYKAVAFITEYAHATVNSIAVACGGTTSYAYKIRKQYFICPFTESETGFKEWTSYGKHKAEIDAGVDGEWYKSIKGLSKKEFERKAADFKAKFPTLVPTIAPAHFKSIIPPLRQPVPTDLKELPVYTTEQLAGADDNSFWAGIGTADAAYELDKAEKIKQHSQATSDFAYNLTKGGKSKTDSNTDLNPINTTGTYTRSSVLDTAKQYVTKDREATHGNMEDNFESIGMLWEQYFDYDWSFSPTDVAMMMALLKIARLKSNKDNPDNYIDACGYMACAGELALKKVTKK